MTAWSAPGTDALGPLRAALLSQARRQVDAIGSQADADAHRLLDDAAAQAADLFAQARAPVSYTHLTLPTILRV